jgi:hypothetical protein
MVVFVASAALVACYKPSFRDCAIACDSPNACPSGLTCDMNAGMCTSGASCSGIADASGDSAGGDGSGSGSGSACAWTFTPTNFDPCTIPAATGSLDVQQTDTYPINTATCPVYTFQGVRSCLLHYTSVTLDGKLTINGALPVIIVSDTDITVGGTITAPPTNMSQGACHIPVAATGGTDGAGGGGGGYGGTGGNGGAGASTPSTAGAAAIGMQSLEPLMLGCPGGKGADGSNGAIGGRAGYGGGALELSAQGLLRISGLITMNGEGGAGGQLVAAGPSISAGGGGGGTGGSILLEASAVTIPSGGGACAIGGGGGQGGNDSALNNGTAGQTAQGCSPALGGGDPNMIGTGGKGGALTSATSGIAGAGGAGGGGGGGGSEGRIRVHSIMPASISQTALFAPLPYVQ